MRVRYVKTLAKASSGMSLKAEHSGRVMMTLESSPRPPGEQDRSNRSQTAENVVGSGSPLKRMGQGCKSSKK